MDQKEIKYYQYTSKDYKSQIEYYIGKNKNTKDKVWLDVLIEMKQSTLDLLEKKPKVPLIMNEQKGIELTRKEVFGFLSLMYFGLTEYQGQYKNQFNFYQHMNRLTESQNSVAIEKLQCIKSYFNHYTQLSQKQKQEKIKITKLKFHPNYHLKEFFPQHNGTLNINVWQESNTKLEEFEFIKGSMFDEKDKIIVDFADPFIGGLVLDGTHCAQEEILMCLYPEAIISSLFFSKLEQDEAIYFENVLRTSNYTGYENTFKQVELDFNDYPIILKSQNLIAIDAYPFTVENQFHHIWILRELNKAFVGFSLYEGSERNKDIVSGKWGCGIFGGDVFLKILLQIAAFSQSLENIKTEKKPKLFLNLYQDKNQKQREQEIKQWLQGINTVGELVKKLVLQKKK